MNCGKFLNVINFVEYNLKKKNMKSLQDFEVGQ